MHHLEHTARIEQARERHQVSDGERIDQVAGLAVADLEQRRLRVEGAHAHELGVQRHHLAPQPPGGRGLERVLRIDVVHGHAVEGFHDA